jgi:hypothetical protein
MGDPPRKAPSGAPPSKPRSDETTTALAAEGNKTEPIVKRHVDPWLCRYLFLLVSRNALEGNDELIMDNCLSEAAARFNVFARTGTPQARYCTWAAIHAAAAWSAQLERRGLS